MVYRLCYMVRRVSVQREDGRGTPTKRSWEGIYTPGYTYQVGIGTLLASLRGYVGPS